MASIGKLFAHLLLLHHPLYIGQANAAAAGDHGGVGNLEVDSWWWWRTLEGVHVLHKNQHMS